MCARVSHLHLRLSVASPAGGAAGLEGLLFSCLCSIIFFFLLPVIYNDLPVPAVCLSVRPFVCLFPVCLACAQALLFGTLVALFWMT